MATGENLSAEDLREILVKVEGKKPTQRVMAAINYLEEDDATQKEIANRYGYSGGWLSQWLTRLERLEAEPVEDVVYDEPRSGRPSELSDAEHGRFVDALHEPPTEADIDARAWTVPVAQQYLREQFDVEYCDRHVRRLMTQAGLSQRIARSQYANADDPSQKEPQKRLENHPIWTTGTKSQLSTGFATDR